MQPSNLKAEQFAGYPPEARKLAVDNLAMLQKLPLSFLLSLLRELIEYDYKFPVERYRIEKELAKLSSLSVSESERWFQEFSQLTLSPELAAMNWVNSPAEFLEQESAHLWATHQMDAFRKAALDYGDLSQSAMPAQPLPVNRLGVAVVGQSVANYDGKLFRMLREHGTYFGQINPENGLNLLMAGVVARATEHPVAYGHWYIDGGSNLPQSESLTYVSYKGLDPVRVALMRRITNDVSQPGMGPQELRTDMARITPSDLGLTQTKDPVLDRFQVRLLTEGSGTQIFSTTFVQWASREALRRAQPLTLFTRFAPRQRQRPMNELLSGGAGESDLDPEGSLVDAEMGAYYQWINQQRLAGADNSSFLVWFEGHSQALVISPSLPRGTESKSALDLGQLFKLATS